MDTMEQRIVRWEDQRSIKNLMGKYAGSVLLNRDGTIFADFWSTREDISLGFNDGWYRGRAAVEGYYSACTERGRLVASLIRDAFPKRLAGQSDEEISGVGTFRVIPVEAPIIEIAGDRETAKGLWSSLGSYNNVEPCGPLAHWAWGWYAADFVREENGWKLWHMLYVKDIDCVCGESWGKPPKKQSPLPEFAALSEFSYPPFTEVCCNRELYSPYRPFTPTPRIPEAYHHFSETFSYDEGAN